MDRNELQLASFQMISMAGDALNCFHNAILQAKEGLYEQAEESIKNGEEFMHSCHKIQTRLLTAECNEEDIGLSILFVHAQDHLMTTINYERFAVEFISLYRLVDELKQAMKQ